jgi:hypothetical protein
MQNSLIPALDPAPLPGPPWLFQVLWVVTFFLHLLFVNAVLGGSLLAALAGLRPRHRRTAETLVEVNSWAIPLAITFGVAPLLFVQVVLGRFFYTATIVLSWWWMGMLGLVMVGYYLNYVAKWRFKKGKGAAAAQVVQALAFLAVAAIQVMVSLLHMQPARWEATARSVGAILADPTFVPRYLHFVLAAVAMAGAAVAWFAVRRAAKGGAQEELAGVAGFGIRVALVATLLQLLDGFWLLLALPEAVLRSFMRGGAATMVPLTLAILAGVLLLVILAQVSDPLAQAKKVRRAAELIVGAMAFMVVTRQQIRAIYLAASRAGEQVAVAPQWGVLGLFLLIFVVGMGITIYALVRAGRDRAAPGELAA